MSLKSKCKVFWKISKRFHIIHEMTPSFVSPNGTSFYFANPIFITSSFPFISLHIFLILKFIFISIAETSMDQDLYGACRKQRIESLTTDGEGEFNIHKTPRRMWWW